MKAYVINFEMQKKEIELPSCFEAPIRADMIHKVFEASKKQQPYAAYALAGKEAAASSKQRHRRRKYKTLYGHGISRVPRKVMTRRGERFYWRGAFIPGTVGGRAAHPPKAQKRKVKVNKKERKLALKAAIASTASKEILEKKYSNVPIVPVIIEQAILEKKVAEILKFLSGLGIKKAEKKIRAGKGKKRGRKYRKAKALIVVSSKNESIKKLKKFFDIIKANQLSVQELATGGIPGRLVVWTEQAIKELENLK